MEAEKQPLWKWLLSPFWFVIATLIRPYRISLVHRDGTEERRRYSGFERDLNEDFGDAVFLVARTKWLPRKEYAVYERARKGVHTGFTDRDAAVMFARFLPIPKRVVATTVSGAGGGGGSNQMNAVKGGTGVMWGQCNGAGSVRP